MRLDSVSGPQPLRKMQELARAVEGAGFGGLWLFEGGRTAYLSCAAAALAVDRIDIGTAIALAFPRSPMITAQIAWELAETTGGRFRVGLGTQVKAHIERRYATTFDRPGPRLREYVLAMKAMFHAFRREEKPDFEGEFFRFNLLPDMWSPGPIDVPDPPIYTAGRQPVDAAHVRRGRRRPARPPVEHAALRRRGDPPERRRRARGGPGRDPGAIADRVPGVHDRRRHRRGAGAVAPGGPIPDRVLRLDAHLPEDLRAARMGRHAEPLARAAGQG